MSITHQTHHSGKSNISFRVWKNWPPATSVQLLDFRADFEPQCQQVYQCGKNWWYEVLKIWDYPPSIIWKGLRGVKAIKAHAHPHKRCCVCCLIRPSLSGHAHTVLYSHLSHSTINLVALIRSRELKTLRFILDPVTLDMIWYDMMKMWNYLCAAFCVSVCVCAFWSESSTQ